MKYYLDSEFIDDGSTIDLISIGIVCEDGREYYAQSCEFKPGNASEWVRDNVLSHLSICATEFDYPINDSRESLMSHRLYRTGTRGRCELYGCPWRACDQIRDEVQAFLNPPRYGTPELYGWCSGYDFVAFCQLFGTMMQLPQQEQGLHNALADARHLKKLWEMYTTPLTKEQEQEVATQQLLSALRPSLVYGDLFSSPNDNNLDIT